MQCPHRWHDEVSAYRPGQVIADKYLLLEPLGAGGMGEVWTAQNLATGADVAIKVLLASRASSVGLVERFRHEAHATAQLSHRGIVRVFDLVQLPEAGGSLALVMERLRGKTLFEHLEHHGPLSVDETLAIMVPILAALHHAHGVGIIHRDLKPENIFLALEPDGEVIPKLLDFGIAKMLRRSSRPITIDGHIVGTPSHMSPEQVRGDDVDARSDIFCAGILLHMCLTGQNPYASADDPISALTKVFEVTPEQPAHVTPAVWAVIARALAQRADDRYGNANELADALVGAVRPPADETLSTCARTPTPTQDEFGVVVRARRRVTGIALAACVAGLVFAILPGSPRAAGALGRGHDAATKVVATSRQVVAGIDTLAAEPAPAAPRNHQVTPALDASNSFAATVRAFRRAHDSRDSKNKLVMRDPGF